MRCFEETRELAVSAKTMFDVVMDIDRYPEFLPWVAQAKILSRTGDELTAELTAELGGRHYPFQTVDRFIPGKIIEIRLLKGPFRFLESVWTFEDLTAERCRVHFSIEFEFKSMMLDLVASPLFATACRSMVHAFENRAVLLSGESKR
ncbi:MAG: type II toxin-antitoxin system RatA family toxin [Zetaproteobacteria bacterium]|nr:MAG: type II toxin-antitoxin system RatA family toxin [Zetaproteobacteria bacterium]